MNRIAAAVATAAMIGLVSLGCASEAGDDATSVETSTTPPDTALDGPLTVAAASSLTDAFTEIGEQFQAIHPDVAIAFTFDSSASLAHLVDEGAPVDVFASADERSMVGLAERRQVERGPIFARNELVIVVPRGNPDDVAGLADLAALDVVSLCGPEVPCGRFAADVLERADVTVTEDHITRGQNARATLGAVVDGDADAAIVYVTDAESAGSTVSTVDIDAEDNITARYPIAVVTETEQRAIADAFVAYVTGPEGQAVLTEHGFLAP